MNWAKGRRACVDPPIFGPSCAVQAPITADQKFEPRGSSLASQGLSPRRIWFFGLPLLTLHPQTPSQTDIRVTHGLIPYSSPGSYIWNGYLFSIKPTGPDIPTIKIHNPLSLLRLEALVPRSPLLLVITKWTWKTPPVTMVLRPSRCSEYTICMYVDTARIEININSPFRPPSPRNSYMLAIRSHNRTLMPPSKLLAHSNPTTP